MADNSDLAALLEQDTSQRRDSVKESNKTSGNTDKVTDNRNNV